MNIEFIVEQIKKFRDDRDWGQFHTPKNLAITLSLEASELLEHFQWTEGDASKARALERKAQVQDELGDVLICAIELASMLEIDLEDAILQKLKKNAEKYPVERAKGTSLKYDEL